MKTCEQCHVQVASSGEFCPLCGDALHQLPEGSALPPGQPISAPVNTYPDLSGAKAQYNLILRLLLFLSLLGGGLSVLVNLLVPVGFWWCLIVLAALCYLWVSVPPFLRRGANYAKGITAQIVFASLLAVALDFIIGWNGWSASYVIPSLLDAGIVSLWLMVAWNYTSWAQYIFYQVLIGVFGFAPLVLYLLGIAQNLVMVLVTAGLALASLLLTFIFGDRSLKTDFKRRFHI